MSLLIKALKQAERRHQEALQQVTEEAAAVEAAQSAETTRPPAAPSGGSAPGSSEPDGAGVPQVSAPAPSDPVTPHDWPSTGLALEPRLPSVERADEPGSAEQPAEPAGTVPQAGAPAAAASADEGPSAGAAVGDRAAAADDGAPARGGLLGMVPARMEAPAVRVDAAAHHEPLTVAPAPVAAAPVADGPPVRPATRAAGAARSRPGARGLALLGLAAGAAGVAAWLWLEMQPAAPRPAPPPLQGTAPAGLLPPLGEPGPAPSDGPGPGPVAEAPSMAAAPGLAPAPASVVPSPATVVPPAAVVPSATVAPPPATAAAGNAVPADPVPAPAVPPPVAADARAVASVPPAVGSGPAGARPAPAVASAMPRAPAPAAREVAGAPGPAAAARPPQAPTVRRDPAATAPARLPARAASAAPPEATVARAPSAAPAEAATDAAERPDVPAADPAGTASAPAVPRFVPSAVPGDQVARLLESAWAASLRSSASARPLYEQVLRLDRHNVDALAGLASLAARDGDRAGAERLWRRVLEVDPNDPTARAGLVTLLGPADTISQESHLRGLLARDASDPGLHYALGNVLAAQSRWAEAQQAFFAAVAGDPEQPDYLFNLAVSLERIRQPQAALPLYRKALAAADRRAAGFDPAIARSRIAALESPPAPASGAAPERADRPVPPDQADGAAQSVSGIRSGAWPLRAMAVRTLSDAPDVAAVPGPSGRADDTAPDATAVADGPTAASGVALAFAAAGGVPFAPGEAHLLGAQ